MISHFELGTCLYLLIYSLPPILTQMNSSDYLKYTFTIQCIYSIPVVRYINSTTNGDATFNLWKSFPSTLLQPCSSVQCTTRSNINRQPPRVILFHRGHPGFVFCIFRKRFTAPQNFIFIRNIVHDPSDESVVVTMIYTLWCTRSTVWTALVADYTDAQKLTDNTSLKFLS